MKKVLIAIVSILLLASCGKTAFELSNKSLLASYETPDRSINLVGKEIKGFINLNLYLTGTEVNNIYLGNNEIELLDISGYNKLGRIDLGNNNLRFGSDLKLPANIRHINVSNNKLTNLEGFSGLEKLKTLDVSYNNLDEEDIKGLTKLNKLQYLNVEGNDVSQELLDKMTEFNKVYLSTHAMPYVK
ncbi:leucine-rich repeat domain-containing protein [Candidatus Gracilibacteria bacterium 28_42_T64]|nr:leucine-rich repeat domain-containing protein [Candidatus Gracilibacteria bacterium 28_42_T64]